MKISRHILSVAAVAALGIAGVQAQNVSLDSCRNMALRSNKSIRMADEAVRGAGYERKSAKAAYLPGIDFTADICTTSDRSNCSAKTQSSRR